MQKHLASTLLKKVFGGSPLKFLNQFLASNRTTPEELAAQKVQNAPLGLTDPNADKKPKPKPEKTRYSARPKEEDNTQPYLGKPETAPQAAPAASQPAVPGTPAAGPPNQ